ncbi:WecB/TagA/CpsF family glycosyltransferase [Rubripirellula tenax]|nr:WecB/TagA/CpsF family glycosyltransferase [Rubripirellula tenax]
MSTPIDASPTSMPGNSPVVAPTLLPSLPAESPPIRHTRSVVWGVPFDHVTLDEAVDSIEGLVTHGQPAYVITANLNYAMLNHRRDEMKPITREADLILADGQPIVWRSRLNDEPLPERVAGSEMIYRLAQRAGEKGWGIYFLGGAPGVAATCAERLSTMYPGLRIAGVESPPFRKLSDEEQAAQDARIKESGAAILLVAFGQPKGEQWIHENYRRLGVPVSIQLGASFDFIAGTAKRAPEAWQRFGMEWAYRMLSDPKRLVPRYAANASFLFSAIIEDWKQTVIRWGMWTPSTK